jgi:hypothetical protein
MTAAAVLRASQLEAEAAHHGDYVFEAPESSCEQQSRAGSP